MDKNEKLIIKKEENAGRGVYSILSVYSSTKRKVKELSESTGKTMRQLVAIMIDYAIDRIEIVEDKK